MGILDTLDELNELVDNGGRVPLLGKRMVPDDEIKYLINTLRKECPTAVKEAESIIDEKERIIEQGKEEANRIIKEAKDYAKTLVEEDAIHKQAEERAAEILKEAEEELAKAKRQAETLRGQATNYAQQILARANDEITASMKDLSNLRESLMKASASLESYRMEDKEENA